MRALPCLFIHSCEAFRFTAKVAVHPAQIAVIDGAFGVSDEQRARARQVVALFAENPEADTLALDDRMIDRPHLAWRAVSSG